MNEQPLRIFLFLVSQLLSIYIIIHQQNGIFHFHNLTLSAGCGGEYWFQLAANFPNNITLAVAWP